MTNDAIRVTWEPSRLLDEVLTRTGPDDYGLYQAYGHHVVFGPGALLYVGKAAKQKFGQRFARHAAWLKFESDVRIRLGRLAKDDYTIQKDWADWSKKLDDIEALTIYWHSPPYNSKNIVRYNGAPLRVQNWGDRGRLLPEYSSHWAPLRPDDAEEK